MVTPVILPKFDMTMEQGTIAHWLRREGERVEKGEPIVEVETDKVNMEIESPTSGILAGIRARPGQSVPVTHVIAYVIQPGEQVPAAEEETMAQVASPQSSAVAPPPQGSAATGARRSVAAAPAVRRLAAALSVELTQISGTGPGGQVTEADVRAAAKQPTTGTPLAGRRRTIAQRMAQSAREIPHIHLTRSVDMSAAAAVRGGASYTAVIVWAAARALREHPLMRASLENDAVVVHDAIHIGVAVDAPEGLIVPVVQNADQKDLPALHREIEALAQRARDNALTLPEVTGGVFTVSNLGMWGVDRFTSLINPPQSAILSVGAVRPAPWAVGESVAVRPVSELTLAVDHRVADGAAGARFLHDLCAMLEQVGDEPHPSA